MTRRAAHAVRRVFDDLAPEYVDAIAPRERFHRRLRAFLDANVRPGDRVLDVGCGPGHRTAHLPKDVRVVYADLSPAMLEEARARRPGSRAIVHDYHAPLPQKVGRFDVVVAASCLDFCRDLRLVLGHLSAAARPGGRLFFTVIERRPTLAWHERRRRAIAPDAFPGVDVHLWTFVECARALARAGLDVARYEHAPGWLNREGGGVEVQYGYWEARRPRA